MPFTGSPGNPLLSGYFQGTLSALQVSVWLAGTLTWRWSLEDVPAVASISTPSSFRVRNMSPRYQGTEMVISRSLHDTTLSPVKRCGCGIAADTDQDLRHLPKLGREHLLSYQPGEEGGLSF